MLYLNDVVNNRYQRTAHGVTRTGDDRIVELPQSTNRVAYLPAAWQCGQEGQGTHADQQKPPSQSNAHTNKQSEGRFKKVLEMALAKQYTQYNEKGVKHNARPWGDSIDFKC